jgi:L-fuculose-phosphate aldolase
MIIEPGKAFHAARMEAGLVADLQSRGQSTNLDVRSQLAVTARLLSLEGHDSGLAGQITARAADGGVWTLRLGCGFGTAQPDDMVRTDGDLNVVEGDGVPNPATRFHLWIYRARPDVQAIVHTHSKYVSALAAAAQPLVVATMDMTVMAGDCGFLAEWPGVPLADEEGRLISGALGDRRALVLAHHGGLTVGASVAEACVLAYHLERSARTQVLAAPLGGVKPVNEALAREAHDFILKDRITQATFAAFEARVRQSCPDLRIERVVP